MIYSQFCFVLFYSAEMDNREENLLVTASTAFRVAKDGKEAIASGK